MDNYIKELHEKRGMIYKADFLDSLSKAEFENGMIEFDIPDRMDELEEQGNGESVWGWVSAEDKKRYEDDNFYGELKCILCNLSLIFYGLLFWGTEVVIKCNGSERPVLSYRWMKEEIMSKDWYK